MSVNQVTMISLEELIPTKYNYRKFKEVFNCQENRLQIKGYGIKQRQQGLWNGSFI